MWVGLLAAAGCVVYFRILDHAIFSTAVFAPIFKMLLSLDVWAAWLVLGVCVLALLWVNAAPILTLVAWLGRHACMIALASAVVFAIGALYLYQAYPLSMDEYAAVFQSKIFASAHLTAQLPPSAVNWLVVRGFNGAFLFASPDTGRAIEGYWPGFSLLLAPFQIAGIPWACNPVLGAIAIYLMYRITWGITADRLAAGWAILFALSSGAFSAYAISYYSMQAHLTLNLLFAYLLLRPTLRSAFVAGLVGSLALILHNPFPHTLFALPWLVSIAADARQRARLGALLAGYVPGLCAGAGWLVLRAGILPAHGFAAMSGVGGGVFVWPDAAIFDVRSASVVKLWLWASPCLFLFAILGARRCWHDQRVRLLAYSALLTFVGYCFVRFDQGHGWGYRYFHSAWGCIPILAACALAKSAPSMSEQGASRPVASESGASEPAALARGVSQPVVPERAASEPAAPVFAASQPAASLRLAAFAGALCILSLLVVVPYQMHEIESVISRHLAQLPSPRRPGENLYLLKPKGGFYLADMVQIDPWLRGPDLLLVSRGAPLDAQLIQQNWPDARLIAAGAWGQQWYLDEARIPDAVWRLAFRAAPAP